MSTLKTALPGPDEMYRAFHDRDSRYDGVFFAGVTTTGIYCRPSCPARKPAPENVEFFRSPQDAEGAGYRPCLRCRPLDPPGLAPVAIRRLLAEFDSDPSLRLRDRELKRRGLDPATVRRWFQRTHGMSFHDWQRARRLGTAVQALGEGAAVTEVAFGSGYDSLSGFTDALRKLTGRTPDASRDALVVRLSRILTPLGPMVAGVTDEALCLLEFADRRTLSVQWQGLQGRLGCVFVPGGNAITRRLAEELEAYFSDGLSEFEAPVRLVGTPFQEEVWRGLRRIPRGETRSYAQQATELGRPQAVRAVARANGANRIAIVIPCHRVIGSDGRLRGYGGGVARKRALLALEGWREPGPGGGPGAAS